MNKPLLPPRPPVTLHEGSKVSSTFYDRNKRAATAGIPHLRVGKKRTFRQICGEAHWLTLNVGEKSIAGLCGVTMVLRDELPLILAGKSGKNAQLYLLK